MMVNANGDPNRAANPTLTTAVAKGYIWNQLLITGKVKNMKALVAVAGLDDSYIRKLLPLAWLAPDVVEAVMEGREPKHIRLQTNGYTQSSAHELGETAGQTAFDLGRFTLGALRRPWLFSDLALGQVRKTSAEKVGLSHKLSSHGRCMRKNGAVRGAI
jgi:hypothetical protein